jgi:hypothetical protein
MILTTQQLGEMLVRRYQEPERGFVLLDSAYQVPTEAWLVNVFAPAFGRNMAAMGIDFFQENKRDCDKFARHSWSQAAAMHGRTPTAGATGLPFGWCIYDRDDGERHEINPVIVERNGVAVIVEWEPQTQMEFTMSEQERRSLFILTI